MIEIGSRLLNWKVRFINIFTLDMMRTARTFLLLILSLINLSHSASNKHLTNYDIRSYHPENHSLKDLIFEVRIPNLASVIKDKIALDVLKEIYFKVFWIFPGKYHIEVHGMPRGFWKIRNELKSLIQERLDFVIPKKLDVLFRSYNLSSQKKDGKILVTGTDRTQMKKINKIELFFKNNGQLEKFKVFSPAGVLTSTPSMKIKAWSHNKWVVYKSIVEKTFPHFKRVVENRISYNPFSGFGFPTKIEVRETLEVLPQKNDKASQKKPFKQVIETEIIFSKYQVNTGKAKNFLSSIFKK